MITIVAAMFWAWFIPWCCCRFRSVVGWLWRLGFFVNHMFGLIIVRLSLLCVSHNDHMRLCVIRRGVVSFGTEVRDFTLILCTSMVRAVGWMWDVRISSLSCYYT